MQEIRWAEQKFVQQPLNELDVFFPFCCLSLPTLKQVEGLTEQVGVEHPRKLISFTLTGDLTDAATLPSVVHTVSKSTLKNVPTEQNHTILVMFCPNPKFFFFFQICGPLVWRRACFSTPTHTWRCPSTRGRGASSQCLATMDRNDDRPSSPTPPTPSGTERWSHCRGFCGQIFALPTFTVEKTLTFSGLSAEIHVCRADDRHPVYWGERQVCQKQTDHQALPRPADHPGAAADREDTRVRQQFARWLFITSPYTLCAVTLGYFMTRGLLFVSPESNLWVSPCAAVCPPSMSAATYSSKRNSPQQDLMVLCFFQMFSFSVGLKDYKKKLIAIFPLNIAIAIKFAIIIFILSLSILIINFSTKNVL